MHSLPSLSPHNHNRSLQLPKHIHTATSIHMSCSHLSLVSVSALHRLFTAVASALLHTQLKSCLDALVCNSSAIYPSFLPSPPSFYFSSVLLTGGELFHHATDDILLFVKVAEERLPDDCCHLSPLFLLSIGFPCDVLIVPTPYELLQKVAFCSAAMSIFFLSAKCLAKSLSECKW